MGICDSNGADLLVEYSDDPSLVYNDPGHTWNDIRDAIGVLDVTGGDKQSGSFQTFNGLKAGVSKPGLQNVNLTVAFENSTTSFLEFLTDSWDGTSEKCYWLRWSYNSGASGALRRSAKVTLQTNPFTGGNAGDGNPVTKQLTHVTEQIYRDVVP